MSPTLTKHESSADRLVEELPSPVALKVVALVPPRAAAPYARQAVTATFVGSVTADLALLLIDRTFLDEAAGGMAGGQSGVVSVTDVLRPAMESALIVPYAFPQAASGRMRAKAQNSTSMIRRIVSV